MKGAAERILLMQVSQLVDEIVAWGEEYGVYIMIDWHALAPACRGKPRHF